MSKHEKPQEPDALVELGALYMRIEDSLEDFAEAINVATEKAKEAYDGNTDKFAEFEDVPLDMLKLRNQMKVAHTGAEKLAKRKYRMLRREEFDAHCDKRSIARSVRGRG